VNPGRTPASPRKRAQRWGALLGTLAAIGAAATVGHISHRFETAPAVDNSPCPANASLVGAGPPAGTAIWCARPDGVRHGTFRSWYASGSPRMKGQYIDGMRDGDWTVWNIDGSARVGFRAGASPGVDGVDYRMVRIDPGVFAVGTRDRRWGFDRDHQRHSIQISRPYLLGATEVTQGLWFAVTGENPTADRCPGAGLGDRLPAACLSMTEAAAFANQLSEVHGYSPAYRIADNDVQWTEGTNGYRLPTNAEWEFAARAGGTDTYAGTDDADALCRYANIDSWGLEGEGRGKKRWSKGECQWGDGFDEGPFRCEDDQPGRAPVASYRPNGWGLFDMTGNVSEWVWDASGAYGRNPEVDPRGPAARGPLASGRAYSGKGRIFRGGGWDTCPRRAQVHFRSVCPGDVWSCRGPKPLEIGLRLARTLL
jgi:formylglycine-generating enzyme required for sulfatase activity